jgi:NitT/TauT family transport system substrate-binding protein
VTTPLVASTREPAVKNRFAGTLRLACLGAAALLALTACGSGSPSGDAGAGSSPAASGEPSAAVELTPIEVGVIPIVDVAPIYLGVDEGIFEKHGLDVTLTLAQGGAAIVPAVQSGKLDFGFSNVTSLIVGRDAGLPLKIVATGPQSTGDPEADAAGVLVPADSDIESVADLEGKRVAVNTLNNIMDSTVSEGVAQAGGNPDDVQFVEMGFPDMQAQLESGNVDAMAASEPFVTMAKQAGARVVYGQFAEPVPDLSIAGYFATDQKIEQDPDLVEAFTAAMQESQQYASDHPEEAKAILPSYTSIEEAVIEEMSMPLFPQLHNLASLGRIAEISLENDLIDEVPPTGDLIVDGGGE